MSEYYIFRNTNEQNIYLRFIGNDRDRFFTSAQRTLIVDHILRKTPYWEGKTEHSKVNLFGMVLRFKNNKYGS